MAGSISRGGRRKALRATDLREAGAFPCWYANLRGLYAHTKPVKNAKIGTPMRPWNGIRRYGSWNSLGARSFLSEGQKRGKSSARERWVVITRAEVMPRRPCKRLVSTVAGRKEKKTPTSTHLMFLLLALLLMVPCAGVSGRKISSAATQGRFSKIHSGKRWHLDGAPLVQANWCAQVGSN